MRVNFYNDIEDSRHRFAVIIATIDGKYIFCKHKQRTTLEIPGGHREEGEAIDDTAKRELYEETGATEYEIKPLFSYGVEDSGTETFGRLYLAYVKSMEKQLDFEMEHVFVIKELPPIENWTYPIIQYELIAEAKRRKFINF